MCRFVFVALFSGARWPLQRTSRQLAASKRPAQACENGTRYQPRAVCVHDPDEMLGQTKIATICSSRDR